MHTSLTYCADQVRNYDPDRFLASLFAPADHREALFVLYAFNLELSRIREVVREPIMGQIRLQWWRDAVHDLYQGQPREHPVIQALVPLRERLDEADLVALVDARETDLEVDPPANDVALKAYARSTGGRVMAMASRLLGCTDPKLQDAAMDLGEAVALAGLLRSVPHHAAAGKSFMPGDLMRQVYVDPLSPRNGQPFGLNIIARLIGEEAERLMALRHPHIERRFIAAFLPALMARKYLSRLARVDYDVFRHEIALRDPIATIRMGGAWMIGSV